MVAVAERLTSLELCAGAGGQALGLEQAGFDHVAVVEIDPAACATLRHNRPGWNVLQADINAFDGTPYQGQVDLLAGGIPCPPFSIAGKQLGEDDERNLFPAVLRLAAEIRPRAVMIENVRGLMDKRFNSLRASIDTRLSYLGYVAKWSLFQASDFGVPQLRPRVVMVALRTDGAGHFSWPEPAVYPAPTVGATLAPLMAENGWEGAEEWAFSADRIAPTIVGGSKKHGGPDLGPVRARQAWAGLGVDGLGVANEAPMPGFQGPPKLTVPMVSLLQGFPSDWEFVGLKTAAYRQVGNAFPPAVAKAVGQRIRVALGQTQMALLER